MASAAVQEISSPRSRAPQIAGAPPAYNKSLEGGYLMAPNEWVNLLMARRRANANQFFVITIIAMRTISVPRKASEAAPEWGLVKMGELARWLDMTERGAQRIVDDLLERGMIACEKRGRDSYYKILPEQWRAAPPYEPRVGVSKKPVESAEESNADAAGAEAASAPTIHTLVVLPGAESRPIPLGKAVKAVHWRNDGLDPLNIAWSADGGLLSVGLAADTGTHVPVSDVTRCAGPPTSPPSVRQSNTGTYVPVSAAQPLENQRITLLEACLLPLYIHRFGPSKPLPAALVAEIDAHLRGAPIPMFIDEVHERFKRPMSNPRHLLKVADDVADHHEKVSALAATEERRAEDEAERIRAWNREEFGGADT